MIEIKTLVYVAYEMTTPDKIQYKEIDGDVLFPALTEQVLDTVNGNLPPVNRPPPVVHTR